MAEESSFETLPVPGVYDLAFFGAALQTARLCHHLSQGRLGGLADVPRSAISAMELGHAWMALPQFLRVCQVLGLSIDDLCGVRTQSAERELFVELRKCPGMATLFLQFLQTPHPRATRRALTP